MKIHSVAHHLRPTKNPSGYYYYTMIDVNYAANVPCKHEKEIKIIIRFSLSIHLIKYSNKLLETVIRLRIFVEVIK